MIIYVLIRREKIILAAQNMLLTKHKEEFLGDAIKFCYSFYVVKDFEMCDFILKLSFEKICGIQIVDRLINDEESFYTSREFESFVYNSTKTHVENIKDVKMISWPVTFGPLMWRWIHIVAPYLDLNVGLAEKISFVHIVQLMIKCELCEEHYKSLKQTLCTLFEMYSISDMFLILHTVIEKQIDINNNDWSNDVENTTLLINQKYKKEFQQRYFKIFLDD